MTPRGGSILQCLACDVTEDGSLPQDIIPAKRLPHFSWWMPDGRISLVKYTDRNTLLP